MTIQRGFSWTGALFVGGLAVAGCVGSAEEGVPAADSDGTPLSPGSTVSGPMNPDPKADKAPGGMPIGNRGGSGGTTPVLVSAKIPFPVSLNGAPSSIRRLSRDELVASLTMLTGSPLTVGATGVKGRLETLHG